VKVYVARRRVFLPRLRRESEREFTSGMPWTSRLLSHLPLTRKEVYVRSDATSNDAKIKAYERQGVAFWVTAKYQGHCAAARSIDQLLKQCDRLINQCDD
jgi:hypothetical protein